MSFRDPWLLLGLLLIPLGLLAYTRAERTRRAGASAFARAALLPSVAPRTPGWRRHAPPAAYALAGTALVLALAQPQAEVSVPVERASIVLATDVSGSMQARDVAPSRLAAAQAAAKRFLSQVPEPVQVGVMAFNQRPRTLQSPTTDRAAARRAIERLEVSGGTATGEAIAAALRTLQRQRGVDGGPAPGAIVLLSDGASTSGQPPLQAAAAAQEAGVPVYTVALGTPSGTIEVERASGGVSVVPVPPDPETLRQIAEISGGRTFAVSDADALTGVYEQLGSKVGTRLEQREVTSAFAGGALLLLLAGAGLSLHWFRRLA